MLFCISYVKRIFFWNTVFTNYRIPSDISTLFSFIHLLLLLLLLQLLLLLLLLPLLICSHLTIYLWDVFALNDKIQVLITEMNIGNGQLIPQAEPWLRQSITSLSLCKPRNDLRTLYVELVDYKMAMGQDFLRIFLFTPVTIIPPLLHS
jgi:hypothetical protein